MKVVFFLSVLLVPCMTLAGGSEIDNPFPLGNPVALTLRSTGASRLIEALSEIDPLFKETLTLSASDCIGRMFPGEEILYGGATFHVVDGKSVEFPLVASRAELLCQALVQAGVPRARPQDPGENYLLSTANVICSKDEVPKCDIWLVRP